MLAPRIFYIKNMPATTHSHKAIHTLHTRARTHAQTHADNIRTHTNTHTQITHKHIYTIRWAAMASRVCASTTIVAGGEMRNACVFVRVCVCFRACSCVLVISSCADGSPLSQTRTWQASLTDSNGNNRFSCCKQCIIPLGLAITVYLHRTLPYIW